MAEVGVFAPARGVSWRRKHEKQRGHCAANENRVAEARFARHADEPPPLAHWGCDCAAGEAVGPAPLCVEHGHRVRIAPQMVFQENGGRFVWFECACKTTRKVGS